MDFRQTNSTPVNRPEVAPAPVSLGQPNIKKSRGSDKLPKWLNLLNVVILFGVAALLALLAFSFSRTDGVSESKLVDHSQYQAVFLNNGQVYFGNVTSINSSYLRLVNIFYLTQNSTATTSSTTAANGDYSLVKLGCQQIHYPYDQMIINRSQVTFWENLNKDGKVVQSIKSFQKQNPNGPDCSKVTTSTQSSSNAATQGAATNTQGATGTPTTGKP